MLDDFRAVETAAAKDGLTFGEAMRLLAGAQVPGETAADQRARLVAGGRRAVAGEDARRLRDPDGLAHVDPGAALKATLRPYQQAGVRWLHLLSTLGLGACLADDMGLGKTMQVLALLLVLQARTPRRRDAAHEPAGRAGIAAGELGGGDRALRPEPAGARRASLGDAGAELKALDATGSRASTSSSPATDRCCACPRCSTTPWRLAVLDEAQAIKNPGARQTRAAKQLDARRASR